jgi:hypothetical protein
MKKSKKGLRLINAPVYRYWQALLMAFYSSSLYLDVYKRWRGFGVLYLFLLFSIAVLPLSIAFILKFNHYFESELVFPMQSLPILKIEDGKVVLDKPMPYLIKNPKGEVVSIVDTTGVVKSMTKKYPYLSLLVTQNMIYFRTPEFPFFPHQPDVQTTQNVYSQSVANQIDQVFDAKESLKPKLLLRLKYMADLLMYPILLSVFFGMFLVPILFFSFFGQLLSTIVFKYQLTFKQACRLYIVASTPQLFLFFILLGTGVSVPYSAILFMSISAAYFSYAVMAVRKDSRQMVRV